MNLQAPSSKSNPSGFPPAVAPSGQRMVNPHLTSNLCADYEALQNDMRQAQELAADFQRQLAGKSNEFAQLKQLFEKTNQDLTRFQAAIVELRAERHRLANEAMRATAFEMRLAKMTAERDRLASELDEARRTPAGNPQERDDIQQDSDGMIVQLVKQILDLKQALEEARNGANGTHPRSAGAAREHHLAKARLPTEQFIEISYKA